MTDNERDTPRTFLLDDDDAQQPAPLRDGLEPPERSSLIPSEEECRLYPRKVIAVDFDDTIREWRTGRPILRTILAMRKWHAAYHLIVIYTARREHERKFVAHWLRENDVPYDIIRMEKLRFDLLVDDKAVSPAEVSRWEF